MRTGAVVYSLNVHILDLQCSVSLIYFVNLDQFCFFETQGSYVSPSFFRDKNNGSS